MEVVQYIMGTTYSPGLCCYRKHSNENEDCHIVTLAQDTARRVVSCETTTDHDHGVTLALEQTLNTVFVAASLGLRAT